MVVKACGNKDELWFILLDYGNHDLVEGFEVDLVVDSKGKGNVHSIP